jgi:Tfp pilus assembly protein PilV
MNRVIRSRWSGFSLIEVVIAIGIVSFSILAVVGLLPTGLKTVKNANEQAGAANVLNAIAESLRQASSADGLTFSNAFAGQPIQYNIGASPTNTTWTNLTLEGVTNDQFSRIEAQLSITPPSNSVSPGQATISVAWSANPNLSWNSSSNNWAYADGSITTGIQFLPRYFTNQ